jgi:MFS family permease
MQSLVEITTLQERSTYMGLFGACFGLASILGPLVGGALTDHASWRWCCTLVFRHGSGLRSRENSSIDDLFRSLVTSLHQLAHRGDRLRDAGHVRSSLPILIVPSHVRRPIRSKAHLLRLLSNPLSFLKARPPLGAAHDKRSLLTKIIQIDWVGLALAICFTTIICLALEYGGVTKAWNDPAVIALFVLIPVSLGILVAWTLWLGPQRAMLPLGLLKRCVFPLLLSALFILGRSRLMLPCSNRLM